MSQSSPLLPRKRPRISNAYEMTEFGPIQNYVPGRLAASGSTDAGPAQKRTRLTGLAATSSAHDAWQNPPTPVSEFRNPDDDDTPTPVVTDSSESEDGSPSNDILNLLSNSPTARRTPGVNSSASASAQAQATGFSFGPSRGHASVSNRDRNVPFGSSSEESDDALSTSSEEDSLNEQPRLEDFREEQKQVHVIATNPGKLALLPHTWAGHFKGIPLPDGLFYKKVRGETRWPRIYERTPGQDYHGSKVFLDIIKVQSRVRDIRNEYLEAKEDLSRDHVDRALDAKAFRDRYNKALSPVFNRAIKWAWTDSGLQRVGWESLPTVYVIQVEYMQNQADAIWDIRSKMNSLAEAWRTRIQNQRKRWREEAGKKHTDKTEAELDALMPKPPVIYAFAIMEHNVLILHQDASNAKAAPFFEMNLNMETDNQRQWYALMVMVAICYARDRAMQLARTLYLPQKASAEDSDPDA